MKKHFFKAPFRRDVYISLRFEGRKFAVTEDGRFIVAAEPLTLREYYIAFVSEVPFQAYVEDRAELVLPDDLENVAGAADEVSRGRGRVQLKWRRYEDFDAKEEVEIRGRLSGRGIAEVSVRGYGEVRDPYVCRDPDDCMWPATVLTLLYWLTHEYKVLEYRGASTVEVASKLLSDPKNNFNFIEILGADVDAVERMLREAGFEVKRWCEKAKAELRVEKISENRLHIVC
ncbi:MAG: hypothetical protein ACO2PM_18575 [Pyrobaculum sp.]|jgi:hypothetical protein